MRKFYFLSPPKFFFAHTNFFLLFLNRHRRTKYFPSSFSSLPIFHRGYFRGFYFFALDIPSRLDDRLKYRVKKLLSDQLSREHTEKSFSFLSPSSKSSSRPPKRLCFLRRHMHTDTCEKEGGKRRARKVLFLKKSFSHFYLKKLLANATKS
jgi:hypothetical protein